MNDDLTQYFIPQIERSGLSSGLVTYMIEKHKPDAVQPYHTAYFWSINDHSFTKNEKNFGLDQFNEEFGEKYIFLEYVGTEKDWPRFMLKGGSTHERYLELQSNK